MGWNSTRHIGAGVVFELDGACHEPVRATTQEKIAGTLTCFGRVVVTGTLLEICHTGTLAGYLSERDILLRDYPHGAEPFRDKLGTHAEQAACRGGPGG
jgi:hypothetical protein